MKHIAVLVIHGIAGGTYDEERFAFDCELVRNYDVFQFTLPGHNVKSIRHSTCEEWISSSEEKMDYLISHGYKKIYLVGHSMGGVIATYLTTKYKEVKKLVLVAPSFSHIEKEEGLIGALHSSPNLIKAYSFDEIETRITKLPIRALNEFIKLVNTYQDVYKEIDLPVMILHGSKDQLVPIKTTREIFKELKNNHKVYVTVRNYYHDIFNGNKVNRIDNEIVNFLKKPVFLIKEEKKEL